VAGVLIVCLTSVLAACGSGPRAEDESSPDRGSPAEGSRLTLSIAPATVEPGHGIGITVKNGTSQTITYGLANKVERLEGGSWMDVSSEVFGSPNQAVREPLLGAAPGHVAGPDYDGGAEDRFLIPATTMPGHYRVSKLVDFSNSPLDEAKAKPAAIYGEFVVASSGT